MAGNKKHRISKVAAELNVSWKSLIESLDKSGFEVDNKMTAKISQEMYESLQQEYQSDRKAKEESQALEINIRKDSETLSAKNVKAKKTKEKEFDEIVLIKDTGLSHPVPEVEEKPKEEKVVETKAEEPVAEPKAEIKEEKVEEKVPETPKVEPEASEPEVKKETKEEPKEETKEKTNKPLKGLKVLGKIDIEDKPKTEVKKEAAPKKKTADKADKTAEEKVKEEPKAETPVVEPKAEEKPAEEEKAEKPVVTEITDKTEESEEISDDSKDVDSADDDNVKKTKYEKLGGLTIKGKIKLPDPPKKKPVASSAGKVDDAQRKKRKRTSKKKIDPSKVGGQRRSSRKDDEKAEITEKEIQDKIKATLAKLSGKKGGGHGGKIRSKMRRQRREDHKQIREEEAMAKELENRVLKVTEFVTANELASLMDVSVNEVITACFSLGMMVSINQRLDAETIQIVGEEFGFEVEFVDADETVEILEEEIDDPASLVERPPIVTVMGHVDHGKTSLLDFIRSANVIAGEAGGITQHVAAYEVTLKNGKNITFVDTPGHEAFTAMRARGAKVTDVAIIVIAADDSVMPQTKEAISHAQAAGVPIVFALNKIDKDGANPDKVREELSQMNILVEEWGGKYQAQEISAKNGLNIDELLEKVLLEAELLELKANPDKRAKGTVMEARLDRGRGIMASLLVEEGTLQIGDALVAGHHFCRVKAMFNERLQPITEADPSTPVNVLGFTTAPTAGDIFQVMKTETDAKDVATKRTQLQREQGIRATKHITLDEIGRRLAVGNFKELKIIVKADVDGSAEALADSLLKLSTEQIQVNVIHKSVGQITESDVLLASASDAIIVGFQVRPAPSARKLAETEMIDIRHYSVIYKAIDEIKSAMEGLLAPEFEEKVTANVEVRDVFKITKVGSVAGCYVLDGKVSRDNKVRIVRDGVVVYTGELASLKRFKDDVKEVGKTFECGIQIKNYNDVKVGDILECYEEIQVKAKL